MSGEAFPIASLQSLKGMWERFVTGNTYGVAHDMCMASRAMSAGRVGYVFLGRGPTTPPVDARERQEQGLFIAESAFDQAHKGGLLNENGYSLVVAFHTLGDEGEDWLGISACVFAPASEDYDLQGIVQEPVVLHSLVEIASGPAELWFIYKTLVDDCVRQLGDSFAGIWAAMGLGLDPSITGVEMIDEDNQKMNPLDDVWDDSLFD